MLGVRQKQQQRKWRRQGEGAAPSSPTAALSLGRRETRPGLGGRREGVSLILEVSPSPSGLPVINPCGASYITAPSPRGGGQEFPRMRKLGVGGCGPDSPSAAGHTLIPLFPI